MDRWGRRMVLDRFAQLKHGGLELVEGDAQAQLGQAGSESIRLEVHDPRFYRRVMLGGSLGAADSFVEGQWSCDDLPALIRLMIRNSSTLSQLDSGWSRLLQPARRIMGWLNRNNRRGSRRNIAAHYDLGNRFFEQFLDETMTYSSGVFETEQSTLYEASLAKYDRACRKLNLSPGDHVLEIGTGWGGFAAYAARKYGCRVTTTTISREQHAWAQQRIKQAGLEDQVELLLMDYRDLAGKFDKLVSIEMIEAVGHEYLPVYFGKCCELLKPDGAMLLQGITIPDQRYDEYRRSQDFIQKYIFPGGCLPSLGAISDAIKRATDFRITHLEDFASHYAQTLALWRARFHEREQAIRELGAGDDFIRTWDYYFSYCQGAFETRHIGVAQILLARAESMHPEVLSSVELRR